MKFTCTQENFNRGLLIASHIANRNVTLPILNNVLIKASSGLITLSTTNLEIGITAVIRGKVEQEGEFTVQAKLIADYVNLLPKENIGFELANQTLKIECGNHKTAIKGTEAGDFPEIPEIEDGQEVILKVGDLKSSLSQVLFAVSIDESRPEISGVLFSFSGGILTMVGTDSYRLAEKKISLVKGLNSPKQVIVPLRTLQEAHRILSEAGDQQLTLVLNDNQILFKLNDEVKLTSRLVEGQYPDYQQIIPETSKTQAKVKAGELVRVIKSAALFCKPGINDVNLKFFPDKSEIVVSSINSSVGENIASQQSEISGDANEVVFNYRYLLDGLNNLPDNEVILEIVSDSAPGILRPEKGDDYLYIIMPIRQ